MKKIECYEKYVPLGGHADSRKQHLVKWQEMIQGKKVGGLGVRNLRLHSKKNYYFNGCGGKTMKATSHKSTS